MISDEAVDAAAKAMAGFDPWARVPEMRKNLLRRDARKALEAGGTTHAMP